MKQITTTIFIIIFVLFGTPMMAHAAPELQLGIAIAKPDRTASLHLSLSGATQAYAGMNAKILLPKGINVTGVSQNMLLSSGNFTVDYEIFSNDTDNSVIVIVYSETDTFGSDGILLTLRLSIDSDIASGEYAATFATADDSSLINLYALSDAEGSASVSPGRKSGLILIDPEDKDADGLPDIWEQQIINANTNDGIKTIYDVRPEDDFDGDRESNRTEYENNTDPTDPESKFSSEPGDINGDGNISLTDAILSMKLICGINTYFKLGADANGDGKIGLEEVIFILQKVAR